MTTAVQALGTSLGFGNADRMKALFTNVTVGQSQRGGVIFNMGTNLGFGTIGVSYTGSSGTFGGSYDIIERQVGGANFSSELNYDGKEGLSVSGNAVARQNAICNDYLEEECQRYTWCNPPSIGIESGERSLQGRDS